MNQVKTFLTAVEQADFITVNQGPYLSSSSWQTAAVEGKLDNQVFRISWEDGTKAIILTEEGIEKGEWYHHVFTCDDHEGDPVILGFFSITPMV